MTTGHHTPNPLGDLVSALIAVMQATGYVQRTGKNAFHGYSYATEADVLDKLRPAMIENGLILIPSVDGEPRTDEHGNTHLVMAYTLAHVSGAIWPQPIRVPGCGGDKSTKTGTVGDKGTYKAMTGANKYLLYKLFQIATGDDPEMETGDDGAQGVQRDKGGQAAKAQARKPAGPPPKFDEAFALGSVKAAREWAKMPQADVTAEAASRWPGVKAIELDAKQAESLFNWIVGRTQAGAT